MAETLIIPLVTSPAISYLGWVFSKKDVSSLNMPGTAYKKPLVKIYGSARVEGTPITFASPRQCFVAGDWKGKSQGRKGKTAATLKGKGGVFSYQDRFFGTFMYAFCEGPVSPYGIIVQGTYHGLSPYDTWANSNFTFFEGTTDQQPWSIHQHITGSDYTPAYRKISLGGIYNMPLIEYGNTFPSQMSLYCYDTELGTTPTIGSIVLDICLRAGLSSTQIDVSELTETFVYGYSEGLNIGGKPIGGNPHGSITTGEGLIFAQNNTSYKDPIAQLASVYLFYKTQLLDGTIAFKHYNRGSNPSVIIVSPDDLGATEGNNSTTFNFKRTATDILELPSVVWLGFYNNDLLGQKDSVPARCEWATHNNEQSFDVEIFMTTAAAVSKATAILQFIWATAITYSFTLPPTPQYIDLIVGDLLRLPNGETVQLTSINIGANYIIECEAHYYDGINNLGIGTVNTDTRLPSNNFTNPIPANGNGLVVLDINLAQDTDSERGVYLAATGNHVRVFSSYDAGFSYSLSAILAGQGIISTITSGTLVSWSDITTVDATSSLTIPQSAGVLSSISLAQVAEKNQNVAFIGVKVSTTVHYVPPVGSTELPGSQYGEQDVITHNYVGEIVIFQTVTVSGSDYVLTNFTRGCRGTNFYMGLHTSNEIFVLLDGPGANVSRITILDTYIGKPVWFQTTNTDWQTNFSDSTATCIEYQAISLKPYAQQNVAYQIDYSLNIIITWDKVMRGSGLVIGEEADKYSIDILGTLDYLSGDGGSIRTLTSTTNTAIYTTDQQKQDFGELLIHGGGYPFLYINLYKVSRIVGRGYVAHFGSQLTSVGQATIIAGDSNSDSFKGTRVITGNYTLTENDNGYWIRLDNTGISGTTTITITVSNSLPLAFRCFVVNPIAYSGNHVTILFTGGSFVTTPSLLPDSTALLFFHGDKWTVDTGEQSTGSGGSGGGSSSPLNTKGDIYVYGTNDTRLPVGTIDGQLLKADSSQTLGLSWFTPPYLYWNTPVTITSTSSTPRLPGDFLLVDVSGCAISITMPLSSSFSVDSRAIKIIDIIGTSTNQTSAGFGLNNVTLYPSSGQTIYGASSYILNRSAISPEFTLIGTDWRILGGIVF